MNAVKDVGAYQLAYRKSAETMQNEISDIHSSVTTIHETDAISSSPAGPSAHFVDRDFVHNGLQKNGQKFITKVCFECGCTGCWSTTYSPPMEGCSLTGKKSLFAKS